ncbi:movement protein [Juncus maritimus associated virus]|uniref:Movement protein n=1 Tax=Juncus maritimus associated virus TaxID=2093273 RepID=A0A2I8B2J6_9GEMI|nr:movement protein [Juncus maritimus associated virus]AUT11864.1 movement protein [Juncus maritimus associated virus]
MADKFCNYLDKRQVEPAELLPLITRWIVEKGSAQQFIDWINGLQREEKEIFRALNACSDSKEDDDDPEEVQLRVGPSSSVPKPILQAQSDGLQEEVQIHIS